MNEHAQTRIVIAAGGTAGHVVPALAVADALRSGGARVVFIGGGRAEAELVPAAGYELRQIAVEGLSRRNPLRAARAVARSAAAVRASRALLRELSAGAVMGGGGYVAGPVGLAALSLRVPLVLTEADRHLGLANRALAPWARRVCLAFALPGRDGPRYRVTGRPVPAPATDRAAARELLAIPAQATCVLVFGGSLGARSINLAALEGLASGGHEGGAPHSGHPPWRGAGRQPDTVGERGRSSQSRLHVLHVCGSRDWPELSRRPRPDGYDLREYLDSATFSQALAASDLVVARSGGSVFELAAHGCPAVLVPYPHASADHQSANARWMAGAGAAVVVPDAELDGPRLAREVGALLADRPRLAAMARASAGLARPDAAADVAAELLEAAR
ncbi:MAG TPA: UDP-N-acetylglucosamine--N-acetylmuramyl-(pentapeptide) pyrophosphoryl-undecaprenol N-acetylglucosamine transferase [Solirubrobacteraceae bacterium]|jgi:UDP-N-acetylglucosamine--N-acetylmuramyl-(pentapeptide) pyrophosphoryl-undecaprenol N-acetylglucosamine transferase|nr:UDP-N-acetylglucosamine--N-acetylmuramyl-(pentapeptide) pyrophosphoryl-undecaprenol N-acetylglucosamine transferase [Solirubrobacteraceae bacterium]